MRDKLDANGEWRSVVDDIWKSSYVILILHYTRQDDNNFSWRNLNKENDMKEWYC